MCLRTKNHRTPQRTIDNSPRKKTVNRKSSRDDTINSLRSRRQHKDLHPSRDLGWGPRPSGGAKRNPRNNSQNEFMSPRSGRQSIHQAKRDRRFRPLKRAYRSFVFLDPGAYAPGFMLTSAPRTSSVAIAPGSDSPSSSSRDQDRKHI